MYLNKLNGTMEHLAVVDPALRQQFEDSKKSPVKWCAWYYETKYA